MADGRKTRRTGTGKRDEKTKLDRELQKINQVIRLMSLYSINYFVQRIIVYVFFAYLYNLKNIHL